MVGARMSRKAGRRHFKKKYSVQRANTRSRNRKRHPNRPRQATLEPDEALMLGKHDTESADQVPGDSIVYAISDRDAYRRTLELYLRDALLTRTSNNPPVEERRRLGISDAEHEALLNQCSLNGNDQGKTVTIDRFMKTRERRCGTCLSLHRPPRLGCPDVGCKPHTLCRGRQRPLNPRFRQDLLHAWRCRFHEPRCWNLRSKTPPISCGFRSRTSDLLQARASPTFCSMDFIRRCGFGQHRTWRDWCRQSSAVTVFSWSATLGNNQILKARITSTTDINTNNNEDQLIVNVSRYQDSAKSRATTFPCLPVVEAAWYGRPSSTISPPMSSTRA